MAAAVKHDGVARNACEMGNRKVTLRGRAGVGRGALGALDKLRGPARSLAATG
jgi:hypothetical protein